VELHLPAAGSDTGRRIYRAFLQWAGEASHDIEPDTGAILAFQVPTEDREAVMVLRNTLKRSQKARFSAGDKTITLDLGPDRIGLAAIRADGTLHAAEAQGEFAIEGASLFRSGMPAMVFALDGRDLRASKAIVLLPMGTGRLTLSTQARWSDLQVQVGAIQNGRWIRLETLPTSAHNGRLSLQIDEDRSLNIFLLTERRETARWQKALETEF